MHAHSTSNAPKMGLLAKARRGFSLVELVVVVMILGILGAIAAPRLLGTSEQAVDNGVRQTLSVVRAAIDTFAAGNEGDLPGADGQQETFKADLAEYLRGTMFPNCPVDAARNNEVRMMSGNETPGTGATVGTHSWAYNYETGDFHINSQDVSADDVTTYDQF